MLLVSLGLFVCAPIRTIAAIGDRTDLNLIVPNWPTPNSSVLIFVYNYFCYVVPFLVGCNYFFLDRIPTLNRMFYKLTWPPFVSMYRGSDWLVLGGIILLAASLVSVHLYLMIADELFLLVYYGPALVGLIGALVSMTYVLRRSHHLHLHHYFIFGVLLACTPFQNPITAMTQALLLGVYVEGIATWGMDPIFPPNSPSHATSIPSSSASSLSPPPNPELPSSASLVPQMDSSPKRSIETVGLLEDR